MIVPNIDNEFFVTLYTQIEHICWENNYLFDLALSHDDNLREEKYLKSFVDRYINGIILFPVSRDSSKLKEAVSQGIPVVGVINEPQDIDINMVKINDYGSMKKIVQAVIDAGHTKIAYIDGYTHHTPEYNRCINEWRYKAYTDVLEFSNISVNPDYYMVYDNLFYKNDDDTIIKKLFFSDVEPPTAVICFHDKIAMWMYRMLLENGINVPQDVTVTGFDNLEILKYMMIKIPTCETPIMEIASTAVDILFDLMKKDGSQKPQIKNITFDAKFINRENITKI